MPEIWDSWVRAWRNTQAQAERRGWQVTPLTIAPPASERALADFEARHSLRVPPQLRGVLLAFSSAVTFGWRIPPHLQPVGKFNSLTSGGLRNAVWDLDHIDRYAIANFQGWRSRLGTGKTRPSEAPNSPQMWEAQFPLASLYNGDMLTIDCRSAKGAQPVRYFSHDLEGLHGAAIAPDFHTFVAEYSALSCAGGAQDDWFMFCEPARDGERYLKSQSSAGKEWRAWVAQPPGHRAADEPPDAVLAKSAADRALLAAAEVDSLPAAERALDQGANPDACLEGSWNNENVTAFTHAVRHSNIAMMELLAARGATIDTRRLPLGEAAALGTLEAVQWLIAHGARVNGWKGERDWPLHRLIRGRRGDAPGGAEAFLAILDALLAAGADPNAPWQNRTTMLMYGGPETVRRLIAAGADPRQADYNGGMALHHASSPEIARVLVEHGADVNALSVPHERIGGGEMPILETPLQRSLYPHPDHEPGIPEALIALGADPRIKDSRGLNALFYCRRIADVELMLQHGLDLQEPMPDGGTLLHHLCWYWQGAIMRNRRAVELITFLVDRGIDINARNGAGETVLHLAARNGDADDVSFLLDLGADKSVKDGKGRTPAAVAARDNAAVRVLLQ